MLNVRKCMNFLFLFIIYFFIFISAGQRQVTVLELKEIEKEYLLVSARLKLANHEQDSSHVTGKPFSNFSYQRM